MTGSVRAVRLILAFLGATLDNQSVAVPDLSTWLKASKQERLQYMRSWEVSAGEGVDLARDVLGLFKSKFGSVPGVEIDDEPAIGYGTEWAFVMSRPFVYDRRIESIPESFAGFTVRVRYRGLPDEFSVAGGDEGYPWAPSRFERFVDRDRKRIAREL